MKIKKKALGAMLSSLLVISFSLTVFASAAIEKDGLPKNGRAYTEIKNNHKTAVGITDCSASPCDAFIGITASIQGIGADFKVPATSSSGTPTCQVTAHTDDIRGFISAKTYHRINLVENGQYVNYNYDSGTPR